MCNPALIGAGVGLAGSVVQGIGASNQLENASKQEKLAAEHQARQYERNAKFLAKDYRRQARTQARNFITQAEIHDRQKTLERIKGGYDAARMTERGRGIVGGAIAAFASSGIAIEGSIADVVRSTGESAALDIAARRFGTRVAWENENILSNVNRDNARRALKYGDKAAEEAIKFGKQSAKDARKFGAGAAASASAAAPIAFITPVISQVGTMFSSGVFN